MAKREPPTEREIRLRFILLAILDAAKTRGVDEKSVELARQHLQMAMTEDQVSRTIALFLSTDQLRGFSFVLEPDANELMRQIVAEEVGDLSSEPR